MLDFREFKSEFIESCKKDISLLTDIFGCEDIEIEEKNVTKAQRGNLTGLIFRAPDTVAAPTYYVEDFFRMYRDGTPLDRLSHDAAHSAFHFIHEAPPHPLMASAAAFEDPANLRVRLINRARNSALLETVPHMDAGCGLVLIAEVRSGDFRAIVTDSLMKSLGMSEVQLVLLALANTAAHDAPFLADLSEMMLCGQDNCRNLFADSQNDAAPQRGTVSQNDAAPQRSAVPQNDAAPPSEASLPPESVYVLSNSLCFWGASVLFYPGMTRYLTELLGGDFYVIPSSVHEVLLLNTESSDANKLAQVLHEGNSTVTEEEDFLSDDLMLCEAGSLRIVDCSHSHAASNPLC